MASSPDDIQIIKNEIPPARPKEAAEIILHYLDQLGVEFVFGVPGGAIEPLYNALAHSQKRGGPRAIVARHESGAAFMADGYYRETGNLAVCCSTTGPGATNMLTGVASAYEDNTPMLVITAQTPIKSFGKGATQESSSEGVDVLGIYKYCTHYNSLVSHIDQLEVKITSAITAAYNHKGPVHISIPLDLMRTKLPSSKPSYDLQHLLQPSGLLDLKNTKRLSNLLNDSKKTIFVIGESCHQAIGEILELAVKVNATLVTTPQGKGLVSSYHPLFKGVFGVGGHTSATESLRDEHVDLILAIGTCLDEQATNGWDKTCLMNNRLVHIHEGNRYKHRSEIGQLYVEGDLRSIFSLLLSDRKNTPSEVIYKEEPNQVVSFERRNSNRRKNIRNPENTHNLFKLFPEERRNRPDRRMRCSTPLQAKLAFTLSNEKAFLDESSPIKPQRLMYELSARLPRNTRIHADIGNSFLWAIHYLHPANRRISGKRENTKSQLKMGMGFASMGWAISGAVGAALGSKGEPVVCIVGDGSYLMSGQEITVAIQEALPVVFIILNDSALGTVKHGQKMAHAESIGFNLPTTSYSIMAESMGLKGYTITSPNDFDNLDLNALFTEPAPSIIDVQIDPNEAPPLGERLQMLASGETWH